MTKISLNKYLIIASLVLICLISLAGYFDISFMSDDSLNIISANVSSMTDKFASTIPYYTDLHFRPLWFLLIELTSFISDLLGLSHDNALLFRIENLLLFIALAFITAHLINLMTQCVSRSVIAAVAVLFFPNNVNNICWTIGMSDLLAGTFILSSLFFGIRYVSGISPKCIYASLIFLLLGLLTKETSVVAPIIFLALTFAQKEVDTSRRWKLFLIQTALLALYIFVRLVLLSKSPGDIAGTFSDGTIGGRAIVLAQAVLSLFFPFDYPGLTYSFKNVDLLIFAYLALMIVTVALVFVNLAKRKSLSALMIAALTFLISIAPHILAGYFRPQLILIPFALTLTVFLIFLPKDFLKGSNIFRICMLILFASWALISFMNVKQWASASTENKLAIDALKNLTTYELNDAIVVGLPGRLGQAHLSEYATGGFNLSQYGKGEVRIPVNDIIHTSALDLSSLNSNLRVERISDSEAMLTATGETQYFQITGQREHSKSFDGNEFVLLGQNKFGKPDRLKIVIGGSRPVYIYSGRELKKLGHWE